MSRFKQQRAKQLYENNKKKFVTECINPAKDG